MFFKHLEDVALLDVSISRWWVSSLEEVADATQPRPSVLPPRCVSSFWVLCSLMICVPPPWWQRRCVGWPLGLCLTARVQKRREPWGHGLVGFPGPVPCLAAPPGGTPHGNDSGTHRVLCTHHLIAPPSAPGGRGQTVLLSGIKGLRC